VRWDAQRVTGDETSTLPGLGLAGLVRSIRTPEFRGVTFHEVAARSALNRVPESSRVPFRWTVNPMRGCLHECTYCFARPTHEYLDLDAGRDFETQIVVKTNVVEVLEAELARRTWRREHVALGTNTNPYQRAEGRYRLMPGIVRALAASGTPFSILTKGPLMRRDLPLLQEAATAVPVSTAVSLAVLDPVLQQSLEPGTPDPRARLDLIRAARQAGLPCDVLVAPVLPWLTDSEDHLDALLAALADAGATGVTVMPLHLRGSVKPWFLQWLAREHPLLVAPYRRLYGRGAYVPETYARWLRERVTPLRRRYGFAGPRPTAQTAPGPEGSGGSTATPGPSWRAGDGAVPALDLAGAQPTLF
jgi:DNA repair photolyase